MVKCRTKTLPFTHTHTEDNKTSRKNGVAKRPFKGVRMRSWGSWVSEIRAPGHKTRIWLGSYSTAEAAARAYDAALLCLKGSDALSGLNFPSVMTTEMSSNVEVNSSSIMSPKSIQRVAAAAAHSTTATSTTATSTSNSSSSVHYPATTSFSIPPSSSTSTSPSMTSPVEQASGEDLWNFDGAFENSPRFFDDMGSMHFISWDSLEFGETDDLKLWNFP